MAKSKKSPRPSPATAPARPIAAWGTADRLDLLQTFVQIIEAGSLSAAANQLGTTQPTVSRRLQQLERALDQPLLHRSTHHLKPTEEGNRCYQRAKDLLAGWAAFGAAFSGEHAEPAGHLRIVVPHAFGQQLLVDAVAVFLRRHPKVTLDWELRDQAPDFIAEGVDCALYVGAVRDPLTVAVRLAAIPRIVVAAPSVLAARPLPTHARDLAALPWLALKTFYQQEVVLRHADTAETCRLAFRPVFSTDNLYALRSAALHGLGVGIISSWIATPDLTAGTLRQLVPKWAAPPLPLYLIYPYARYQSAKLRAFVATMREVMADTLGGTVIPPPEPDRR